MNKLPIIILTLVLSSSLEAVTPAAAAEAPQAYQVDDNFAANHCEFYIDSFGLGRWDKASAHRRWIETTLIVNNKDIVEKNDEQILGAGAFIRFKGMNEHSKDGEGFYFAEEKNPGQYLLEFNYEENRHESEVIPYVTRITSIAFFVDIKSQQGRIRRVWVTEGTHDFSIESIMNGYSSWERPLGLGAVRYVNEPSPVFNQRKACR